MSKFISATLFFSGLFFCLSCERQDVANSNEDSRFVDETYQLPSGETLNLKYDSDQGSFLETKDYENYVKFIDEVGKENELVISDDGSGILKLSILSDQVLRDSDKNDGVNKNTILYTYISIFDGYNADGVGVTLNVTNETPSYRSISFKNANCTYDDSIINCDAFDLLYKKVSSLRLGDNSIVRLYFTQYIGARKVRFNYRAENRRYDPLNPGRITINVPPSMDNKLEGITYASTYY